MKIRSTLSLLVSVIVFLAAQPQTAFSQDGAIGPQNGVSPETLWGFRALVLLNEPVIQRDLKLAKSTLEDIDALTAEYFQSLEPLLGIVRSASPLPQEIRRGAYQEIVHRQRQFAAEFDERALALLNGAQVRRLSEIGLQLRGFSAFQHPRLVARLRLSREQQANITSIAAELRRGGEELLQQRDENKRDPSCYGLELDKLRRKAMVAAVESLRADQQRTYRELCGPALPIDQQTLRLTMRSHAPIGVVAERESGE